MASTKFMHFINIQDEENWLQWSFLWGELEISFFYCFGYDVYVNV